MSAGCRCWPDFIAARARHCLLERGFDRRHGLYSPVFYEFEKLSVPVLLMIGDKDTTALGKNLAPPAVRGTLGNYPVLAKAAASRFSDAHLVEFPDLGHAPQIQAPDAFHKALLDGLQILLQPRAPLNPSSTRAAIRSIAFIAANWTRSVQAYHLRPAIK